MPSPDTVDQEEPPLVVTWRNPSAKYVAGAKPYGSPCWMPRVQSDVEESVERRRL